MNQMPPPSKTNGLKSAECENSFRLTVVVWESGISGNPPNQAETIQGKHNKLHNDGQP